MLPSLFRALFLASALPLPYLIPFYPILAVLHRFHHQHPLPLDPALILG
jgi:hypothetical protein